MQLSLTSTFFTLFSQCFTQELQKAVLAITGLHQFLEIIKIPRQTIRIQLPVPTQHKQLLFPLQSTAMITPHLPGPALPYFFSLSSLPPFLVWC